MISRPGPDDLKPVQLPIQSFRDSQEQLPQLVDEELLTLHLTPYRRMGARHDRNSPSPEIGVTRAAVSKVTIFEETGSIRAVSFAARRQQYVTIEL